MSQHRSPASARSPALDMLADLSERVETGAVHVAPPALAGAALPPASAAAAQSKLLGLASGGGGGGGLSSGRAIGGATGLVNSAPLPLPQPAVAQQIAAAMAAAEAQRGASSSASSNSHVLAPPNDEAGVSQGRRGTSSHP